MKSYDFILAGGGCAGLSLAYYLSRSALRHKSMLIVDADSKSSNDRTWCFWSAGPTDFENLVSKEWPKMAFRDSALQREAPLAPLSYKLIRGIDYYRFMRETLAANPAIDFRKGYISDIGEDDTGVSVSVDGREFKGKWLFNSCLPRFSALAEGRFGNNDLKQHFRGWEIETQSPHFDEQTVTLMDFRTPQKGDGRFIYILPFSDRRALVEYTVFSKNLLNESVYQQALRNYIERILGCREYRIRATEQGAIPMTARAFPRRYGSRIMTIGTLGGQTKATTGYTFSRIHRDSQNIVASLLRDGHPFYTRRSSKRFAFYDRLLLGYLERKTYPCRDIFARLFKHTAPGDVLRFLDESSSILQEAAIFWHLPWRPFLQEVLHQATGGADILPELRRVPKYGKTSLAGNISRNVKS